MKEVETRWRELWPRLLVFADSIVCSEPCCARVSAEELLEEAVLRVARGTRVWDPNTSSLDSFLFETVASCASERPRKEENEVPGLDYELLDASTGSLEQPHHHVLQLERQDDLPDFIESLRNDPPAYNVAWYMVKFGVHDPERLATVLVMDTDKVVATKRRVMRRAVQWQRSTKAVNERHRAHSDE